MAKKKFDINKRSKPMSKVIQEFEGKTETVEVVKIFEKEPSIENKAKAIAAIKNDSALTLASTELLEEIQNLFVKAFSSNTIPSNYADLKKEAIYLADLNQVSGLYMAQRLKIIRDKELYKEDKYQDFKEFITSELSLSKSTVYNYIDLVEIFLESKLLNIDVEKISSNRSKVIPFLPILKSDKLSDKDKESIKSSIMKEIDTKSAREMSAEAKDLKVEYGLTKPKQPKAYKPLISALNSMHESIKLLSHPKANDAYILVLEHLEMSGLISGKELGILADSFNKSTVDIDI